MKQNLERDEVEYIFNLIDEDGNNTIELEEFKKWLKDNDVQMSMNLYKHKMVKVLEQNDQEPNGYQRQISNAFDQI